MKTPIEATATKTPARLPIIDVLCADGEVSSICQVIFHKVAQYHQCELWIHSCISKGLNIIKNRNCEKKVVFAVDLDLPDEVFESLNSDPSIDLYCIQGGGEWIDRIKRYLKWSGFDTSVVTDELIDLICNAYSKCSESEDVVEAMLESISDS